MLTKDKIILATIFTELSTDHCDANFAKKKEKSSKKHCIATSGPLHYMHYCSLHASTQESLIPSEENCFGLTSSECKLNMSCP